jgi:hypothetical protein
MFQKRMEVCAVRERQDRVVVGESSGKWLTGKFGRKSLFIFLHWVFRSMEIIFNLTSILRQNQHPQIM